jgi:hypothetical protein
MMLKGIFHFQTFLKPNKFEGKTFGSGWTFLTGPIPGFPSICWAPG